MATHSNSLAWKIPWTEEPGRLQSTGSQRVRQLSIQHKVVFCFSQHKGYECFCRRFLTLGVFLKNLEKFNE